jgi:hypothetical protein
VAAPLDAEASSVFLSMLVCMANLGKVVSVIGVRFMRGLNYWEV